jgi:hypothetical protein
MWLDFFSESDGIAWRLAAVAAGAADLGKSGVDAALSLLKLQMLDAQVPARRRLSEEMLRELLPGPRSPSEEESKLAVLQPRRPGNTARHAKEDPPRQTAP